MQRILFVCTGNTCRSPMAEAMFRDLAARNGKPLDIRSAGVSTVRRFADFSPCGGDAEETQITTPGPSTALSEDEVDWAELILTLTAGHKRAILQQYPDAVPKTFTLKEFALRGEAVMDDVAEAEQIVFGMASASSAGTEFVPEERARLFELQRAFRISISRIRSAGRSLPMNAARMKSRKHCSPSSINGKKNRNGEIDFCRFLRYDGDTTSRFRCNWRREWMKPRWSIGMTAGRLGKEQRAYARCSFSSFLGVMRFIATRSKARVIVGVRVIQV